MTTEVKRLIRVRVEKGATFKRDGFGKKRQLSDSWRKPRGQHNKQREQKKAKGALPKPGFGSPVAVRGMHPSGFFEVLLSTSKELEGLDPKTQAVRISGTVGDRKRAGLQANAIAAGLKVLNARTVIEKEPTPKPKAVQPDEDTPEQKKKPVQSKVSVKPAKKETKSAIQTPEAEEEKSAVKTTRKSAKPKAEKAADAPETKSKGVTKPKAKKKTESGVKKNE